MIRMTEETLQKMTSDIVREVQPMVVVLFGSHAKGKVDADSDVDLLVVEREDFGNGRSRRREIGRIRSALQGYDIAKDILVYSRAEVTRWRNSMNHIVATALKEGRVLYACE